MADVVEVRAFMDLAAVFKKRNWFIPLLVNIKAAGITGMELLELLNILADQVEVIFVNGKAFVPGETFIYPGDRIALVPPGVPGPYRVLMGFIKI